MRDELVSRFGGITAYTRTPVQGLWHEREEIVRDDLIIYETMVQELKEEWWGEHRKILENRFEQQSLVVRATRLCCYNADPFNLRLKSIDWYMATKDGSNRSASKAPSLRDVGQLPKLRASRSFSAMTRASG